MNGTQLANLMKSNAAFLQVVIDSLPFPIFIKNQNGVYIGCNKQYEIFMSRSKENVLGKTVFDLHSEDYAIVYQKADEALLVAKGVQIYEAKVPRVDHDVAVVKFHKTVFFDDEGNAAGIIGAIFDISEQKKLEQQLIDLACIDDMTGLLNRREALKRFSDALALSKRQQRPLSTMILDIDHFKSINDRYGHDIGDKAIKLTASILKSCSRDVDTVARYGGEEFLIVLPDASQGQAMAIAERCRQSVADARLPLPGNSEESITVSAGVSTFGPDERDAETLLKQADIALYKAKEGGRNQVCV